MLHKHKTTFIIIANLFLFLFLIHLISQFPNPSLFQTKNKCLQKICTSDVLKRFKNINRDNNKILNLPLLLWLWSVEEKFDEVMDTGDDEIETDGDEEALDEVLDDETDDFLCFTDDDFIFLRLVTCGVDKLCLSDAAFDNDDCGGGIALSNSWRLAALRSNSQLTRSNESKKPEQ